LQLETRGFETVIWHGLGGSGEG